MDIDVKALTTYAISEDGESVALKLQDATGAEQSLRFPLSELGNLVMTLPGLIESALRRQYCDASFRFAYPVGSWSVEEAEAGALILTLRTVDGFGVSFSMARGNAERLGNSIATGALTARALTTH
jgi:hypothetical protein